jgi:hypothetical protein
MKRRLYVDEEITLDQVAALLGVAPQTVHNRLDTARTLRRASPARLRTDILDDQIRLLHTDRNPSRYLRATDRLQWSHASRTCAEVDRISSVLASSALTEPKAPAEPLDVARQL